MPSLPASVKEISDGRFSSPEPEWYHNRKGELHFRAQRLVKVDNADKWYYIEYLQSEAGAYYPHEPPNNGALVRRYRMIPRGAISGTAALATYNEQLIRIWYDTDGPIWVNGVYVQEALLPDQFYMQIPRRDLWWAVGAKVDKDGWANLKIPVTGLRYMLRVGQATWYPTNAYTYAGRINSGTKTPYIFTAYNFPAQTVKFGPPQLNATQDYRTGTKYTYTYWHEINPNGWNRFWRASVNGWRFLYTNAAATTRYVPYVVGW